MALDRAQTAPFNVKFCNPHASISSDCEVSVQRIGKLQFFRMTKTRRGLCRIRATASSADGSPASDSGYSVPKSYEESCELLVPSEHELNSSAELTSESVDRRLASSPPSETYSEISGNTGIAVSQATIESTSQRAPKHSTTVLANALPSNRIFDASSDPTILTRRGEIESRIARWIVDFRFLALLAVVGFLAASCLCFIQGCAFVCEAYAAFYTLCVRGVHTGKVVLYFVEALDVFLAGTVMLILGMGLYGLFISNVPTNLHPNEDRALRNSSLFGLFYLKERPKWMRICSLDELKSKLGHLIVMILLVKMFERSKAISISTGADLFSYSICIFCSSAALFVLSKLQ